METIHNPDFPTDEATIGAAIARLRESTAALSRPLLIIGGYRSPRWLVGPLVRTLSDFLRPKAGEVTLVTVPFAMSLAEAARDVDRAINDAGNQGKEHDVVGFSMGGLVASAMGNGLIPKIPPLRIARLFTLGTPHRGANVAKIVAPDSAAIDMTPGSPFLESLNRLTPTLPYELTCYTYLRDWWVGTPNTSPQGLHPLWIDPPAWHSRLISHFTICRSRPILVDMALRLRGLEPISRKPSEAPRCGPFTRWPEGSRPNAASPTAR